MVIAGWLNSRKNTLLAHKFQLIYLKSALCKVAMSGDKSLAPTQNSFNFDIFQVNWPLWDERF